MAISTYAELKTAIANWLERSGDAAITANAGDFIALAESRLNRSLTLRAMEAETTLTGSVSSRQLTLPSDFVEPKALFLTTFGSQDYLRPFLAGTEPLGTTDGTPTAWTVNGAALDLDRPCDRAHTFLFRYRKSFALSDSATTNWLLTNHPDAYLFAALVEANIFLGDNETAVSWELRLKQSLDQIAEKEGRSKSRATLGVDPALMRTTGAFSITRGE